MTSRPSDLTERVYDFITEAGEGRICEAIPASACQQAPQNFALLIGQLPAHRQGVFVLAPVFLLIGLSPAGLRLGRKTYLVDGAPDDDRPLYIAVSNTLIGVVTLFGGGLGLLVYSFGVRSVICTLIILALVAAAVCRALPEAHEMAGTG